MAGSLPGNGERVTASITTGTSRHRDHRRQIRGRHSGEDAEQYPEASGTQQEGFAMNKKYAIVIEKGATNYGAYVPDLPGCVAVGDTVEEVERLIREAIPFHIEGMRQNGDPIPEPTTLVDYVETQAA
jgi:predicted RNase H-like HicB family nuclease